MKIDPEFKSLIPKLSEDEYAQLEKNIISEGCRDSLIVWGDILVDGHNRYQICNNHDISFTTRQIDFTSRNNAIIWIIKNQFGRRNLTPFDRSKLALKMEDIFKAKAKENEKNGGKQKILAKGCQISDNPQSIDTKKEIAKIAGVSHDTIAKVKVIEREATPEQKKELSEGKKKINTVWKEIKKIRKIDPAACAHLSWETVKRCVDCGEIIRV